jgi:hypothetical protein
MSGWKNYVKPEGAQSTASERVWKEPLLVGGKRVGMVMGDYYQTRVSQRCVVVVRAITRTKWEVLATTELPKGHFEEARTWLHARRQLRP